MGEASVGCAASGGSSRARNRPLRSRSARTTDVIPAAAPAPSTLSPAKGTMAIGMRCPPAPVISIESWARATGANATTAIRDRATAQIGTRFEKRRCCKLGILLMFFCDSAYLSSGLKVSFNSLEKSSREAGKGSGEDLRIARSTAAS